MAFLREHSIEGLRFTAQRAVVAQRHKIKRGKGCINIYPKDILLPELEDYSDLNILLLELYDSILIMDTYRIEESTRNILKRLFEERYASLGKLKPIIQVLIGTVVLASIKTGLSFSEIFPEIKMYITEIDNTYDYIRLKELLRNIISLITIKI